MAGTRIRWSAISHRLPMVASGINHRGARMGVTPGDRTRPRAATPKMSAAAVVAKKIAPSNVRFVTPMARILGRKR